jgi:hypothetical protein
VATRSDLERFNQRMQTLQTRTRARIKQGVPKDQYLSQLKTEDLGWSLDPTTLFERAGLRRGAGREVRSEKREA